MPPYRWPRLDHLLPSRRPPADGHPGGGILAYNRAQLLSALDQPGCPACVIGDWCEASWRPWFYIEQYAAAPCVLALQDAAGFCPAHSWRLAYRAPRWPFQYMGQYLAEAELMGVRAILDAGLAEAMGAKLPRAAIASIQRLVYPRLCPACESSRRGDRWVIRDLSALISAGDVEVRNGFATGAGLCFPHVHRALLYGQPRSRPWLIAAETRIIRRALDAGISRERNPLPSLVFGPPPPPEYTLEDAEAELAPDWAGCPACTAAAAARARWREQELSPLSQPPAEADAHANLCRRHAWHASATGGRGIVERIARRRAEELVVELAEVEREWAVHALPAQLALPLPCVICDLERAAVDRLLETLGASEAPDRAAQAAELCGPHFRWFVVRAAPTTLAAPLRARADRLRVALRDHGEFFRKSDYRFRHEPKGREQSAWLGSLLRCAGLPLPASRDGAPPEGAPAAQAALEVGG